MFFATVDDVSSAVIDIGTYETRAGKWIPSHSYLCFQATVEKTSQEVWFRAAWAFSRANTRNCRKNLPAKWRKTSRWRQRRKRKSNRASVSYLGSLRLRSSEITWGLSLCSAKKERVSKPQGMTLYCSELRHDWWDLDNLACKESDAPCQRHPSDIHWEQRPQQRNAPEADRISVWKV